MRGVAVINRSTLVSLSTLATMVAAVARQVERDWAPAWGARVVDVLVYGDEAEVPAGAAIVVMLDDADQAGLLGYHDVTPGGLPYARVFARPCLAAGGTLLRGPASVSVTLSHEVLELLGDPGANRWATSPDGVGHALELCDAVEAVAYDVEVDGALVAVSDFVLPGYFEAGSPAPYSLCRAVDAPFALAAGGYEIVLAGGRVSQRFADGYPAWRVLGKSHPAARTMRRAACAATRAA